MTDATDVLSHSAPHSGIFERVVTTERLVAYAKILLGIFTVLFVVWTGLTLANPDRVDPAGSPFGYDFIATWSAARLALEGRAVDAYDVQNILAMHKQAVPGVTSIFPWPYPPWAQMLAMPLGLLPYPLAFILFMGGGLALWLHVLQTVVTDPRARWVALALPAALICFLFGQNGFISAGLMGSALLMLDRRPWLAGLLIGLLAFKPHLGILVPVALLATDRWRTIVAAGAVVMALAGASIALFGIDIWRVFFETLAQTRVHVDAGRLPLGMIPTPYAFGLSIGAGSQVAMALQILSALAAAVCVWAVWRKQAVPFAIKAATLCAATMLVSPYMFHYDHVMLGLAMGFLAMEAFRTGFLPYERPAMIAAWLAPLLILQSYQITKIQLGAAVAVFMLVVLIRRALGAQAADVGKA
jgi:hypothetical protein